MNKAESNAVAAKFAGIGVSLVSLLGEFETKVRTEGGAREKFAKAVDEILTVTRTAEAAFTVEVKRKPAGERAPKTPKPGVIARPEEYFLDIRGCEFVGEEDRRVKTANHRASYELAQPIVKKLREAGVRVEGYGKAGVYYFKQVVLVGGEKRVVEGHLVGGPDEGLLPEKIAERAAIAARVLGREVSVTDELVEEARASKPASGDVKERKGRKKADPGAAPSGEDAPASDGPRELRPVVAESYLGTPEEAASARGLVLTPAAEPDPLEAEEDADPDVHVLRDGSRVRFVDAKPAEDPSEADLVASEDQSLPQDPEADLSEAETGDEVELVFA